MIKLHSMRRRVALVQRIRVLILWLTMHMHVHGKRRNIVLARMRVQT